MNGRLAQLGERLPYKQDVGSSILSSPTKLRPRGVVVNMPACHAGDRRFKSDRGRHYRYSKFAIRRSKVKVTLCKANLMANKE